MRKAIRNHPLLAFFVLAYLLSWVVWVPLTFLEGWDQDLITLVMLVGVLGPLAAGIIVSRCTGTSRLFWKSTLKVRVAFRWYVVTFGLPLVVLFFLLGVYRIWGTATEATGVLHTADAEPWFLYPLVLLAMVLVGGGMEEPGWRGFAQSRMLAHFTPFRTSVIMGIIWTYWHTPLFFVPGSSQQGIELGWYTVGVTSLAVIMTWLFLKTEGSAWTAILFHGGVNAINSWVPSFSVTVFGTQLSGFAVMEFTWLMIAGLIVTLNRDMFFQKVRSTNALVVFEPGNSKINTLHKLRAHKPGYPA